jgi:hypothetical protein
MSPKEGEEYVVITDFPQISIQYGKDLWGEWK